MNLTYRALLSFVLTTLLPLGAFAGSPGTTAANFLKIGIGSRGAAMGEAQSAVTTDVTALHWNPAGLVNMQFKQVGLMHYDLAEGVRYQHASLGYPTENKGNFAFGFNLLDYGNIDGFDANALPTGSVDASNLLVTVGWSKRLIKENKLALGTNVKYLKSELAGFSASAPMLDLGLHYPFQSRKLRNLSVAATLRNLGPDIKYDTENSSLPQQLVLGAGLIALGGNLTAALDLIMPNDNSGYFSTGLEYKVFHLMNLRVGYNGNSEFIGNGITYGMGLTFNQWTLDYAFVPLGDLGDTNRISVGLKFGRAVKLKSAEDQVYKAYNRAESLLASGRGVEAYSNIIDLLLIAPWHNPSVELKAKIEKQFSEMETSKNKVELETDIAREFTKAKVEFDRDNLVEAKKGFTTVLALNPEHTGSQVYLKRIKNRYASLAHESFKQGMDFFAAGDYDTAITMFEKTITIDETHTDARAQLAKAKELQVDRKKRIEEINKLADAADAYREGLKFFQDKKWEKALIKFEEVQTRVPEYEEVGRYYDVTVKTWSGILFAEAKVQVENGQLNEAVDTLTKASALMPQDQQIATALEVARRDLTAHNQRLARDLYRDGLEAYLAGKTDSAEKLWNDALDLDPTNEDAKKALMKLEEQKQNEKDKE